MRELQLHVRSLLDLALGSDRLRSLCRAARLSDRACDEWELCLAEAVTGKLMDGTALEVTFRLGDDVGELLVEDGGQPLADSALERQPAILGRDAAAGLPLLKLLTDELRYDAGPPNRLLLRRHHQGM